MGLVWPLGELTQLVGDKLSVSCSKNPGVAGDHETVAWPGPAVAIVSLGGSGIVMT